MLPVAHEFTAADGVRVKEASPAGGPDEARRPQQRISEEDRIVEVLMYRGRVPHGVQDIVRCGLTVRAVRRIGIYRDVVHMPRKPANCIVRDEMGTLPASGLVPPRRQQDHRKFELDDVVPHAHMVPVGRVHDLPVPVVHCRGCRDRHPGRESPVREPRRGRREDPLVLPPIVRRHLHRLCVRRQETAVDGAPGYLHDEGTPEAKLIPPPPEKGIPFRHERDVGHAYVALQPYGSGKVLGHMVDVCSPHLVSSKRAIRTDGAWDLEPYVLLGELRPLCGRSSRTQVLREANVV